MTRTLLDTNILTRSAKPTDLMHQVAVDATDLLRKSGHALSIVPQNVYEFWVVATRPLAQNGLGMSAQEAEVALAKFKQLFLIEHDMPAIFAEWEKLVSQHRVIGKNAHDARLVAAMKVHGISHILTFNTQDFIRFQGVTVISPSDVLQATPSTLPKLGDKN